MIKLYINPAAAQVILHNNPHCASARIRVNQDQRTILVNTDSLSRELRRFRNQEYQFAAQAGMSDLWVMLDFQDAEFEQELARYLKRLVGQRHKPAGDWELQVHC